jgi:diguanylate cyclase (GGDEF)-like protein/PAS domain S-box-containing protein
LPSCDDARPAGQLCGIDHVQLAMPAGIDAERAAEGFYGDVLGLTRVVKPPKMAARGGCWFESPHVRLHLGVEDPFVPARKAHPALAVDDLDGFVAQLDQAGVAFRPADDVPGVRRGHCTDPFGNRIELVEIDGPTPEMFRTVADHSLFPISMIDQQGVVRWAGWSMEKIYGWSPGELIGRNFIDFIAPHSLEDVLASFANIGDAYYPEPWGGVGLNFDLLRADGTFAPAEAAAVTAERTGLPWVVVFNRQAGYERMLDLAVEAMASGASLGEVLALVVDAVERMLPESAVVVGDRWTGDQFDVTAGSVASLLASHPASPWALAMQTGEDYDGPCDEMPAPLAALAQAEGYGSCWVQPVTVTGDDQPAAAIVVWTRHRGWPMRFRRNSLRRAGQLLRLVLQWDRSHRMLEFAATHDPLTGLANRQAFRDRLATVARGYSSQAALLYLDLDRFKPVNDDLGHAAGDRVLAVVAERLVATLRPGDLVARMGGDEFAVLCERLSSTDDVERVADRLRETVRQPILHLGTTVQLDVSIGITDVTAGARVDTLLAEADDAMRTAKQAGRARWTRHSV